MENNALQHWGIKGMKWGVRRYQNKDGTLTEEGKKRASKERSRLSEKKQKDYKPDVDKWVTKDIEGARQLADAGANAVRTAKEVSDKFSSSKPAKSKIDLSSMSDKELRDRINRAMMEKQYNDLFNKPEVSKGKKHADTVLNIAGAVMTATSSALGIALAIKKLME